MPGSGCAHDHIGQRRKTNTNIRMIRPLFNFLTEPHGHHYTRAMSPVEVVHPRWAFIFCSVNSPVWGSCTAALSIATHECIHLLPKSGFCRFPIGSVPSAFRLLICSPLYLSFRWQNYKKQLVCPVLAH